MPANKLLKCLIVLPILAGLMPGCGDQGFSYPFDPDLEVTYSNIAWDRSNVMTWELTMVNKGLVDAEISHLKMCLSYSEDFNQSFYASSEIKDYSMANH